MKEDVIEKWANEDLWSHNEFAMLCCGISPEATVGERYPAINAASDKILRGILAEAITPKIPSDPVKKCEFYQLDKYYVPADVFLWAKHNFKKFPDFSKCLLSSRILTDEDLLASSRYWSTLQENMINALQDYPEWKANNPGARWTDEVIGWIKTKYEVNDREADLIKTVLKEIFDRK